VLHGTGRGNINQSKRFAGGRPAVFVLHPFALNSEMTGRDEIFMARDGKDEILGGHLGKDVHLSDFLPRALRPDGRRDAPTPDAVLAIEPQLSNRRLQGQDGCFTVHGIGANFMDLISPSGLRSCLICLQADLCRVSIDQLQNQLFTAGLREDDIYQDLGSLCRRINREWNCM
jgi:hypothetical protein